MQGSPQSKELMQIEKDKKTEKTVEVKGRRGRFYRKGNNVALAVTESWCPKQS